MCRPPSFSRTQAYLLSCLPAVAASQYNPTCQGVKLTPPVTEYCRQYKTGPVEDIWTVAGKVRRGRGCAALRRSVAPWGWMDGCSAVGVAA